MRGAFCADKPNQSAGGERVQYRHPICCIFSRIFGSVVVAGVAHWCAYREALPNI